MLTKVRVTDSKKLLPAKIYEVDLGPDGARGRHWFRSILLQYAKDNHYVGKDYISRFWADVVREPEPVATQTTVTTAKGRAFTVLRKGTEFTFESTLTDSQAMELCRKIVEPKTKAFAQDILSRAPHLTEKQVAWIHKLALDQLKVENGVVPNFNSETGQELTKEEIRPIKQRYKPAGRKKAYWPKPPEPITPKPSNETTMTQMVETMVKESDIQDAPSVSASLLGLNGREWPGVLEYEGLEYKVLYPFDNTKGYVVYTSDDVFFLKVENK